MNRLREWLRRHITPRCSICPREAVHEISGMRYCRLHTPAWFR